MRIDGQPWLQAPSGSTTHPSVQHAGAVASHIALRVNCSRVSGVNPSFSKASVAVIRYELALVFIWFDRASIARRITRSFHPVRSRGKSGFNEMDCTLAVGWNLDRFQSTPRTRTEKTHGAWGTDSGGFAEGFAHTSLGSDAES